MNQQIKQQWVDALRSGTYRQTYGTLHDGGGNFCVLGVLCDLHHQATGTPWKGEEGYVKSYLCHDKWISFVVRDWAGVTEKACERVYELNDNAEKTFAELADWIDVNL